MKTNIQNWKQVSISGVTGILMGAGAMKGIEAMQSGEVDEATGNAKPVSTPSPYDNMSFDKAFETARAEFGAGGVFRWHGKLFNTYTVEEWNAKTAEEQNALAEAIDPEISADEVDLTGWAQAVKLDSSELPQEEEAIAETDADETDQSDLAEVVETEEPDVKVALDGNTDVTASAASEQTVGSGDDDVRVLGYGDVALENGQNVTVEELNINGQRVAVVDVDQDGVADYGLSDINHNRQMDEGEVIDLHTGEAVSFTNDPCDDLAMTTDMVEI